MTEAEAEIKDQPNKKGEACLLETKVLVTRTNVICCKAPQQDEDMEIHACAFQEIAINALY